MELFAQKTENIYIFRLLAYKVCQCFLGFWCLKFGTKAVLGVANFYKVVFDINFAHIADDLGCLGVFSILMILHSDSVLNLSEVWRSQCQEFQGALVN